MKTLSVIRIKDRWVEGGKQEAWGRRSVKRSMESSRGHRRRPLTHKGQWEQRNRQVQEDVEVGRKKVWGVREGVTNDFHR